MYIYLLRIYSLQEFVRKNIPEKSSKDKLIRRHLMFLDENFTQDVKASFIYWSDFM